MGGHRLAWVPPGVAHRSGPDPERAPGDPTSGPWAHGHRPWGSPQHTCERRSERSWWPASPDGTIHHPRETTAQRLVLSCDRNSGVGGWEPVPLVVADAVRGIVLKRRKLMKTGLVRGFGTLTGTGPEEERPMRFRNAVSRPGLVLLCAALGWLGA